jgi:AraC-like DNA-binding protein
VDAREPALLLVPPCQPLREIVEAYELLRLQHAGPAGSAARLWPSAAAQLVFNAGDPVCSGDLVLRRGEVVVLGPTTEARLATFSGRVDVVTVSLRAAGLAALLPVPLHQLAGAAFEPRALHWSLDWRRLLELDQPMRIAWLDAWLSAHARWAVRSEVRAATAALRAAGGAIGSSDLQRKTGLSASQLQRLFLAQVGVTAKRYARICRLLRARALLRGGARAGLADVAALAGYADQPHFTREARALTALTPRQLVAAADAVFFQDGRGAARPS